MNPENRARWALELLDPFFGPRVRAALFETAFFHFLVHLVGMLTGLK
jgi:hypothetical protein